MKEYIVYKLQASDESEPFYIGSTCRSLKKRLTEHKSTSKIENNAKSNKIASILVRNEQVIITPLSFHETAELMYEEEKGLIENLGRRDLKTGNLCNHTNGGKGTSEHFKTKDGREKLSYTMRETKRKYRLDEYFRKKTFVFDGSTLELLNEFNSLTEAAKFYNINVSAASACTRPQCSTKRCRLGNNKYIIFSYNDYVILPEKLGNSKKILQFDIKNNFIREWDSAAQAARELSIQYSSIRKVANGTTKTHPVGKWKWSWKNKLLT